ncbi:unnamed protein product [Auanema sp. JU1783]|nr:unnamed protein product [Auanema sp. JU1783]
MPSMFRSLSARFRRQPTAQRMATPKFDPKKQASCKVLLLDGTDLNIIVSKNALGEEVYDQVFYSLDLEERDYFGLLFTDQYNVQHWLDPVKKIAKQVPIGPPFTFRFRVKFFTAEPCSNLKEELTRYQFFLQLKHDILSGRLNCSKEVAIELAAFTLQSELGDYNPKDHSALLISEFRFHPEQDEKMELDILERFKLCRGQTPAQAELNYLNKAKYLEMYGVDTHKVEGKDGNTYTLGLTPQGMLVFDGAQKIGLFFWEKIQKLDFKNKRITLVVEEDADSSNNGQIQLHTFVFNLCSHKACKHLWKCAIEHHTFFRLKVRQYPRQNKMQLFRLGSTFKYRGRTEYETVHKDTGRLSRRTSSTFERRPSQRYGPRQSHAAVRQQKRELIREQVIATINANTAVPTGDLINHSVSDSAIISNQQPSHSISSSSITPKTVDARLDNPFYSQPSTASGSHIRPPTATAYQSHNHVTMIPVGTLPSEKKLSPPSEKAQVVSEPFPVTSPSRSTSRIPKYVVAPMQNEQLSTPLTPPPSEGTTPEKENNPVESVNEDKLLFSPASSSCSSSDMTTSNPPSNANSQATIPNTAIPRPSKSKLKEPTKFSSTTPLQPTGHSRIPKMASGGRMYQSNGGFGSGGSSITYIPIANSGISSTQSRVITQL